MTSKREQTPASKPDFVTEFARKTAQSLFSTEWDGFVEARHAPKDPEDEDFIANLPKDVVQPVPRRAWLAPAEAMAKSMTSDDIADAIASGNDPWAQSTDCHGRVLHKDDPPPSLIVIALAAAQIADTEDDLQRLFERGNVTNFVCPKGPFLWGLDQALPELVATWREHLPRSEELELHCIVEDDDAGLKRPRARQRGHLDGRVERSVARGASVLLVTTGTKYVSDSIAAIVTRKVAWPGVTADLLIEALRLTHSSTGLLAEDEIRTRLPDEKALQSFTPALLDAAFGGPTTLAVADRLASFVRKFKSAVPGISLDDVHGLGEVRDVLDRMLNDLRAWREGDTPWSEVTSSGVFYGPPGTGKTTLAKALAGSANIPIIETSYADCQRHGHQGDMLAAMSRAFDDAKEAAPAVLFIDELDGFSERTEEHHNASYMRGVVNGLLEQMNRAKDIAGLIVLGATNHLETVDKALLRSGRFDLEINVPYPDKAGLRAILEAKLGPEHAKGLNLAPIADRLLGKSGAVAEAVVRDALGRARADRKPVEQEHLDAATDQIAPGLNPATMRRAAIHEAGHVLAMLKLGWPLPKRVCLTAEGGQVEQRHFETLTPRMAHEQLQVLLAGRAAEMCILGTPSSGAGNGEKSDLAQATTLALSIERRWGFGESGLCWDDVTAKDVWRVPAEVRERAERHLQEAERNALALAETFKPSILDFAERLLKNRDISRHDIEAFASDFDLDLQQERFVESLASRAPDDVCSQV